MVEGSTQRGRRVVDVARRPVHALLATGRDPWIVAAGVLLFAVPVAAVISALQRPWVPTGDWALIEMAVRDVGTRHTPLTGVYSRFGWRHPGPLPHYAMAVPYRLVPAGHGLLFAAAVVNLVAVGGCVVVVARYSRTSALVALAGLTVFVGGLGIGLLADPWNPSITLVPFALFLLLGIEVAADRARWALPAATVVGSFVVQAHLGLAVPVAFVVAASLTSRHRRRSGPEAADRTDSRPDTDDADADADAGRTDHNPSGPEDAAEQAGHGRRRERIAVGGLLLLAWAPPLLDQAIGRGNLLALARWGLGMEDATRRANETGRLSPHDVERALAWLLDPTGQWLGRLEGTWYPRISSMPASGTSSPLRLAATLLALFVGLRLAARTRPSPAPATGRPQALTAGTTNAVEPVALTTDTRPPLTAATTGDAERAAPVVAGAAVVGLACTVALTEGVPFLYIHRPAAAIVMLVWVALAWQLGVRASPRGQRVTRTVAIAVAALAATHALAGGLDRARPVEELSTAFVELQPTVERRADESVIAIDLSSSARLATYNLGLAVLCERAGIRWVPATDPEAADAPGYSVIRSERLDDDRMRVQARADLAATDTDPAGELLLVQLPAPNLRPGSWPRGAAPAP